jgi:hypothetical protein
MPAHKDKTNNVTIKETKTEVLLDLNIHPLAPLLIAVGVQFFKHSAL